MHVDTLTEFSNSTVEGRKLTHIVGRSHIALFIMAQASRDILVAGLCNIAKTLFNHAFHESLPANSELVGLIAMLGL